MYTALPRQRQVFIGLGLSLLTVVVLYYLFGSSLSTTLNTTARAKIDAFTGNIKDSKLHFIVPATKGNFNFCQLLLSASVLGWPAPILIGEGLKPANGDPDGQVSHLFKITRTLQYLESLPKEQDDDLVLLVDAYDVWFQLRPEILIKRYYTAREAANKKLISELGSSTVAKHGLRQSIFFNVDKTYWPSMDTDTDMWWLPNSTLPEYAFGPETDKADGHWPDRPRWLNSGAILGPVGDMRKLFNGTARRVERDYSTSPVKDSDQLYFARLFMDQEYFRLLLRGNTSLIEEHRYDVPPLQENDVHEYHVTLDYKSELFLAKAFYDDFMAWITFDTPRKPVKDQTILAPWQIDLTQDVLDSPPPLAPIANALDIDKDRAHIDPYVESLVGNSSWRRVPLGTNLISGLAFPILHFTGDKKLLNDWWSRLWLVKYGRALLTAVATAPPVDVITRTSDARLWRASQGIANATQRSPDQTVGAWSDSGRWMPWEGEDGICERYEDWLFARKSLPPPADLDKKPDPKEEEKKKEEEKEKKEEEEKKKEEEEKRKEEERKKEEEMEKETESEKDESATTTTTLASSHDPNLIASKILDSVETSKTESKDGSETTKSEAAKSTDDAQSEESELKEEQKKAEAEANKHLEPRPPPPPPAPR
ncbi:MAG: hypothetical protein M1820_000862 [Bogoriella megaspora]|nr:MAG: hypothetical protein M1820_000862 [Bogoriella megaspora]